MKTRNILASVVLVLAVSGVQAQTMNIYTGQVNTAVTASDDEMTYGSDGTTLTVLGKTFNISDIDSIVVDDSEVDDNTIKVVYSGTTANVVVAGNIAKYISTGVTGAHVSIVQSADVTEELTYTLEGSADDGSFWMDGELKITLVLNGVSLTCADSAAINIRDGKRIAVELADGTVNTLVDGVDGDQKGCFIVNGHAEFQGGGSLYLTGNTKHAFFGDEYVELKKSTGSITVLGAEKDGFNINQYFEMKGGTVTISNVGDDGIQVSVTDDSTDEQNGQVIISGGTLDISVTATASKGIKCDDAMTISDGTITVTTSGGGEYDSDDKDVSACAALKADGTLTVDGGTLTLKSTGAGGKGMSSDTDIVINDGTFSITTTGKTYTYGMYDALPKGIKGDNNVTINGGDFTISTTGGDGAEAIESKNVLTITGGTIVISAYDDALNASNDITISGGKIYAYSSNNDAIDSNGTMEISGGLVLAAGTTTPEGPFDCDNYTFAITGGTIVGVGGDSSDPTTSATTQPVIILSGQSYSSGSYIALNNSSGETILTFKMPCQYSSAELFLSSPEMSVGNTYTILKNPTVTVGTEWQGYSDDSTASSGTSYSVSLTSTVTNTTGQSSGGTTGPGGGTTGPGGNNGNSGNGNSPWSSDSGSSSGVTIYVNASSPNSQYMYIWDSSYNYYTPSGSTTTNNWPGTLISNCSSTNVSGTTYYYITCDASSVNVIFNNGNSGSGNQTSDITGITSDTYFKYNGGSSYSTVN